MSAGPTSEFLPTLRRLDGELALPLPDRVSILRELAADLEQLTSRLVAQGHLLEDARMVAMDALVPEGSTLSELSRVHAPAYAQITRRLSPPRLRVLERTALAVATTGVLAFEALTLLGTDLRRDPSPFLWPVLCVGALLFAVVATQAFALWIKREQRSPEHGVGAILAISGLVLAVGFGGAFIDFFLLVQRLERTPEPAMGLLLDWLRRDGTLMSVTILVAMVGGLTWFILTQWLGALAAARHEVLGLRLNTTTKGGRS